MNLRRRSGMTTFYAGIWLVFLAPAFARALSSDLSAGAQAAGLALLIVFVGAYLRWMHLTWEVLPARGILAGRGVKLTAEQVVLVGVLLVVVVLAILLLGEPATATIVFLAPIAASLSWGRTGFALILLVTGLFVVGELVAYRPDGDRVTSSGIASGAIGCLLAGVVTAGMRRMRTVNDELLRARQRAEELASAEERVRIARDLHDVLGHSMTVISVRSQLAERLIERGEVQRAAEEIAAVGELARSAMTDVRSAVSGYRSRPLATELAAAEAALEGSGLVAQVQRPQAPVPALGEEPLGFVVREGVTNVLRHSGARSCAITVSHLQDGGVVLEVADDGRGLGQALEPVSVHGGALGDRAGNGLRGLAERVAAAGGRLSAGDRDGRFVLRAEVPA